jgi:hypothetical protein
VTLQGAPESPESCPLSGNNENSTRQNVTGRHFQSERSSNIYREKKIVNQYASHHNVVVEETLRLRKTMLVTTRPVLPPNRKTGVGMVSKKSLLSLIDY